MPPPVLMACLLKGLKYALLGRMCQQPVSDGPEWLDVEGLGARALTSSITSSSHTTLNLFGSNPYLLSPEQRRSSERISRSI